MQWCQTCDSWRHFQPCGRDGCPVPSQPDPLLTVCLEMRAFIRRRFPDDSLASGNWPTIKPLVERWDAVIGEAKR
jgi:hypothetical protein